MLCRHQCSCAPTSGCRSRPTESSCNQTDRCELCRIIQEHRELRPVYLGMTDAKNQRLGDLLACSPAIHDLYKMAVPAHLSPHGKRDRQRQVHELLRRLLQCGENRLNCLRNIGGLARIVPKLLTLRLETGFSEFWTEMRKVAKAVNKQVDRECKLAALVSLRQQLPPSSPWAPFLCSEDRQAEEVIRQRLDTVAAV